MAVTQLSDVIIPAVYLSYTAVDGPELTAFFQSGVIARSAAIDKAFANGGTTTNIPFWKDLDATVEPNYSTDNPADVAAPQKVQADKMVARMSELNQGYSAADLVSELAGSDPMQRIRNRFGTYWARQYQRRLIALTNGVLKGNVANNASDMVIDNSVEDIALVSDANLFARKAFTSAAFTLGDHFGDLVAIAVHSVIMKRMIDNDDIDFIPDSKGMLTIPTYMGRRVIVDDSMQVTAGTTSGYKYTSVLFGTGAVGYGERAARVPAEVYRRPDQGNGAGVEQLWERKGWCLHPFGFVFTSASVAGQSPTNAEMALAANWTRVIERKNVPLAFLITNG
jgi:hypothetical protein